MNKAGKLKCVANFIQNQNLDFVGFQETKKEIFSESFLKAINCHFIWHYLPAKSTAGGILVGFDDRKFEVSSWQNKQYSVSAMVKNIADDFVWRFIVVYGSAYEEGKPEFIIELHELLDNWDGPTLIGGDFNLVCSHKEKNNGMVNLH